MALHGKNFIGDQLSSGTGETFNAVSPLDSTILPELFHRAGAPDADKALQLAALAFESYGKTSRKERSAFLERIADEILGIGDELIDRAHLETGLPKARLTGERARTVGQLRMFAQVAAEGSWVDARIDHAIPDRQPVPRPDVRRMLVPIGPVIVFGSSNFPLAFSVAGGDTASALATGNPVVVKAHAAHPGTSELVAEAICRAVRACRLPGGVFSMVHGSGKVIGLRMVQHPVARAVGFTGSRIAGRALFDAAAARPEPIPVFAEMSSLNPVFVLPQALRERGEKIAEGLKGSMTLGVGQFCTKPGLVFGVRGREFEAFQQKVAQGLESVAPATMLHSGISNSYREGLARASQLDGVKVIGRTQVSVDPAKTHAESALLATDYTHFCKHPELAEEVFGPFAVTIVVEDLKQLEEIAGRLEGQLTATIHGTEEDLKSAQGLLHLLQRKAGRLIINGYPTGVEVCSAMNHGGPYPATTDVRFTSVGTAALYRFVRPVCYQDFPDDLLPEELKETNPLGMQRMVDGKFEPSMRKG